MKTITSLGMRSLAFAALLIGMQGERAFGGEAPLTTKLGERIRPVELPGAAGKSLAFGKQEGVHATAVVFLSFECPVSNDYCPTLRELWKNYHDRGVAFVAICPNKSAPQIEKEAKDYKLPFPILADEAGAAGRALAAGWTPEAFVLDADGILRYRGRIDDGLYARLKKKPSVSREDLREALVDVLAGKSVRIPATQPIGCPIVLPKSTTPSAGATTYYRDVLPILQNHCQSCHRPGEVGPFALMTYRQAVNWSTDIKEFTGNHKMPPWKPTTGPGFHSERKLTDPQIATLAAWVDGGTPAGDPKDAPPARVFPQGWQLGKPDIILTPAEPFHLAGAGGDRFRCFALPTNLPEDSYVSAIEVRPGNPRVVHHALLFVDPSGQGRKLEQAAKDHAPGADGKDHGPGYTVKMGVGFVPSGGLGGLGGWAPGQMARVLPDGTGYFLPKNADVILQVHYHRDGKDEQDQTTIGLYLAKKPVQKRFQSVVVPGRFFRIPAGDDHFQVTGAVTLKQDCELHSVMPHMHLLGRSIKVTMTPPDGPAQTLVAIDDWDYNWQETYFFKQPIAVKAGTRLEIDAIYDNSAGNPNNPNQPPKSVFFGEQTTNEMCFGFIGATSDKPGRIRVERGAR